MRTLLSRMCGLFRGAQLDEDLDADIRAHLDLLETDYIKRGATPEEARLAARRAFGGVEQMKEVHRDRRAFGLVTDCLRDARFGIRVLVQERWFAAAAIAALALGIAATNTVFVLMNGLMLRDLPFADPDRIMTIGTSVGGSSRPNAGISFLDFQDWANAQRTFDGLGATAEMTMNVAEEGKAPERFNGSFVSANAFALIGHTPVLGRGFDSRDDFPGAPAVVVLSESMWRTRYARDGSVIGRTLRVNGVPATVIGIMGEGFAFPARSRLWQPLAQLPSATRERRDARILRGVGRLAAEANRSQAEQDLARVADSLAAAHPDTNGDVRPRVAPFRQVTLGGRGATTFPILMTLVVFVLLIACANVANLLLARAAYRAREIAVRLAVGASRVHIVRQLLIESLLLAGLAGLVGLGLSWVSVQVFWDTLRQVDLPYWVSFPMDWRVFVFLSLVCLATGVAFGLVPALQASTTTILGRLIESGTGSTGTVRQRRWTTRLVVAQLALTPIALTGGGLMMRSIIAQQSIDAGVHTAGLVRMRMELAGPAYQSSGQRERFYRELEERFASATGLRATLASHAPFEGASARRLSIDGIAVTGEGREVVRLMTVGRNYFDVLATPPVRGAAFDGRATRSAIVNERFAAVYLEGRDPVGHRLGLASRGEAVGSNEVEIIGVAPDIRQSSTEAQAAYEPIVYLPYPENPVAAASILVRSDAAPGIAASLVRQHVDAIDRDLPLFDVMRLDDSYAVSDERLGLRVFGTIFVLVGVIALVLAAVGLYAVTAYATAQRAREIGIRIVLGSRPSQIAWLVARRATRQLAVGLSIGTVGAIGVTQLMRGILIGIEAGDYTTLLAVAGLLIVVTFVASAVPATRAMRVNPVAVLKSD